MRQLIMLMAFLCVASESALAQKAPEGRGRPAAQQINIPDGTTIERDVAYVANPHERQKLDLYIPKEAKTSKRPLIVWVHGGGWQSGSKDRTPALPALQRGIVVASINYRLSQHAPFPAQIQDCQAAIRWLKGNSEKYGIDPDHIGVWGASAGGHLVALLGTASDTKAWEPIGEFRDQSPRVTCVVDWFGPSDFSLLGDAAARGDSALAKLIGPTNGDANDKFRVASPVTYVTKDDAPFLIMHGDQDRLVPLRQSERLRDELTKSDVAVELVTLKDAGHGGPEFLEPATAERIRSFFTKYLNPAGN